MCEEGGGRAVTSHREAPGEVTQCGYLTGASQAEKQQVQRPWGRMLTDPHEELHEGSGLGQRQGWEGRSQR